MSRVSIAERQRTREGGKAEQNEVGKGKNVEGESVQEGEVEEEGSEG